MIKEVIERDLPSSNVKVFFVKRKKRNEFTAYRLPNNLDTEVKSKYVENLSNYLKNKEVGKYDFVHKDKTKYSKIEADSVESWASIKKSINVATSQSSLLKRSNFTDDYRLIVIDCEFDRDGEIKHIFLIAKYFKPETWYKKSIKFAFTADTIVEKKKDIIVLNGCIDSLVYENDLYIFQERNFEEIFNHYEAAKVLVEDSKECVETLPFLTDAEDFYAKVISGKGRTLKLANALKNTKTDWANINPAELKRQLQSDDRFSQIAFDSHDRIIYSFGIIDLIIDIIREVYSRQLVTNEIIQTKGV